MKNIDRKFEMLTAEDKSMNSTFQVQSSGWKGPVVVVWKKTALREIYEKKFPYPYEDSFLVVMGTQIWEKYWKIRDCSQPKYALVLKEIHLTKM